MCTNACGTRYPKTASHSRDATRLEQAHFEHGIKWCIRAVQCRVKGTIVGPVRRTVASQACSTINSRRLQIQQAPLLASTLYAQRDHTADEQGCDYAAVGCARYLRRTCKALRQR